MNLEETGGVDGQARRTDPETSQEAARLRNRKVKGRVREIFQTLPTGSDGLNDEELEKTYAERHGWEECHHDSPRKRRSELSRAGVLFDTGVRRRSSSNRAQIVWSLA